MNTKELDDLLVSLNEYTKNLKSSDDRKQNEAAKLLVAAANKLKTINKPPSNPPPDSVAKAKTEPLPIQIEKVQQRKPKVFVPQKRIIQTRKFTPKKW